MILVLSLTTRCSCSICGAYSCLERKHQVRILPQRLGPYQSPEGVVMGFGREEGQDVPRDAWARAERRVRSI